MIRGLTIISMVLAVGCSYDVDKTGGGGSEGSFDSEAPIGDASLNYKFIDENIIAVSCAGCHSAPRNASGVNLETYENVFRNRASIDHAVDTFFMPDSVGGSLSDEKRALLLRWLELGAPEFSPQARVAPTLRGAIAHLFFGDKASAAIPPQTYKLKSGSGAQFEAVGTPSLLRIKSDEASVDGQLTIDETNKVQGEFKIKLAEFSTGIGLRDRHMKEKYLETEKFPTAELKIAQVNLPETWKIGQAAKDRTFTGDLTLKGVTKPVKGVVNLSGNGLKGDAKFTISLKDYPVGVPSYLGITVADEVNVAVDLEGFEKVKQ